MVNAFSYNEVEAQVSFETDTEYKKMHMRVMEKAQAWDQAGRPVDLLLRGAELDTVVQWLSFPANTQPKPTDLQYQYVIASLTERQSRREEALIGIIAGRLESIVSVFMNEVRQPLAGLKSGLSLMRQSLTNSQPDEMPKDLDILDNLLEKEFSVIEWFRDEIPTTIPDLQFDLNFEATNIADLVQRQVEIRQVIRRKGMTFNIQNSLDQPMAEVDPVELGEAIGDILAEVVFLCLEDGLITVTTKNVDEECILISIAVTGKGEVDRLESIFESSLHPTHRLAHATNIVALHHGEIEVKSEVGKGSEFTIRIPTQAMAD